MFLWKGRISPTIIAIKSLLFIVAVILPALAWGDDNLSVDFKFDKTGDGIVDASDWKQMTGVEQEAYARESVQALGEDPEVLIPGGKSRALLYLEGLRAVYE